MDGPISLKRRCPYTQDEDTFALYHPPTSYPFPSTDLVSASLPPEQRRIIYQAAELLQLSAADLFLLTPQACSHHIIGRAASILKVPPQSLLQLSYQPLQFHQAKRLRRSVDDFTPQYTDIMNRRNSEKAILSHDYTDHNHVGETEPRQVLTLPPSGGHSSFLDTAASGIAECFASLATCPPTHPYEPRREYQVLSPTEQNPFLDVPPTVPGPMSEPSAAVYTSPPVPVNWLTGDDPSAGLYIQGYPALQPTIPVTPNARLAVAQPSTRLEAMYYPTEQEPGSFPQPDGPEAAAVVKADQASTTDLSGYPPAAPIPLQTDVPPDITSIVTNPSPLAQLSITSPVGLKGMAPSAESSHAMHPPMGAMEPAVRQMPLSSEHESNHSHTFSVQTSGQYDSYAHQQHVHGLMIVPPYTGGLDPNLSTQQYPRSTAARRGPFKDQSERQKTAQTRKIGSCIRCRMQRIRCNADGDDEQSPCLSCKKSLGRTWRLPCLRLKIGDVELSKTSQVKGYEWTLRWKDNSALNDVGNWVSTEDRIIRVTEGYTDDYVELRVRKFNPQPGDRLERSWVTKTGEKRSVEIPAYAIVDPDTIQTQYTRYIKKGLWVCCNRVLGEHKGSLIWWTYGVAMNMSRGSSHLPDKEREVLSNTLTLWMTIRLTTRSFEIVGNETLGMPHDILDETNPSYGKIPLPPVMGAQLDSVLIHSIQHGIRRDTLEGLHKLTTENKAKAWFTTYLVTFILLHNAALVIRHDASYAKKHGMKRKFAREDKVQQYYKGAITLLAYFHYCNKGVFPFSEEAKEQDIRNLANLDEDCLKFVRRTRTYAISKKKEWQVLWDNNDYENDYYFISQLYEVNWQPRSMVI